MHLCTGDEEIVTCSSLPKLFGPNKAAWLRFRGIMGIILGVIGAIVAIGLMLILMWKGFTTIHDRREYARFEKEQRLAKWDAVRGNSS